jgi:predicted transcriptional regulator
MSKTFTIRLNDDVYQLFRQAADTDNRTLSNFIETATLRYIAQSELINEAEMAEIDADAALKRNIRCGHADARRGRGRFVD